MPEFGSKDSGFKQVEAGRANGFDELLRRKTTRSGSGCNVRVRAVWVLVPFAVVLAVQAFSMYWLLGRLDKSPEQKPHITVVIDLNGTQNCKKDSVDEHPCKKGNLYITSKAPIGPLRCYDDAYELTGQGPNSCQNNPIQIAKDGLGVIIPKDGLYRVHAMVAYFDPIPHQTRVDIRVDPPHNTECLGNHACLAEREKAAHAWLMCEAHQPPASARNMRDFSSCSIDGIRRFSAGQKVGLQVAIGYRELVGRRKATNMYIHEL